MNQAERLKRRLGIGAFFAVQAMICAVMAAFWSADATAEKERVAAVNHSVEQRESTLNMAVENHRLLLKVCARVGCAE